MRYAQLYILYKGGRQRQLRPGRQADRAALRAGLPWEASGPFPGTAFVEGLTGYVYFLIGSSLLGGFFVFSWLGFWGLLLFQRAFATALPDADCAATPCSSCSCPSLLFWPSSIGKEAWMTLSWVSAPTAQRGSSPAAAAGC